MLSFRQRITALLALALLASGVPSVACSPTVCAANTVCAAAQGKCCCCCGMNAGKMPCGSNKSHRSGPTIPQNCPVVGSGVVVTTAASAQIAPLHLFISHLPCSLALAAGPSISVCASRQAESPPLRTLLSLGCALTV
jgi:hypothetical protein